MQKLQVLHYPSLESVTASIIWLSFFKSTDVVDSVDAVVQNVSESLTVNEINDNITDSALDD